MALDDGQQQVSGSGWVIPDGPPPLADDEAHVWRVGLDLPAETVAILERTLAPEEMYRADKFLRPLDRRRFVTARGVLRRLLGRYLEAAPGDLRFGYGPQGKPSLAPDSGSLSFNLSHSADAALIAVCSGGEIGIDVEAVRSDCAWQAVAHRFFCPAEIAWLYGLPAQDQRFGFFTLWTRKEAFLKARGGGLWRDLTRFDVSRSPPRALDAAGEERSLDWSVIDLSLAAGYAAAVVVPGAVPRMRTLQCAGIAPATVEARGGIAST